jgi:hypothetical protein
VTQNSIQDGHYHTGTYVKIKSSHGGHLEFPISKRFTNLVQDHPMIIPAMGKMFKQNFPLKPVSQFKANMA